MTGINKLVSELLRAANTVDQLSASSVTRMLDESIDSIRRLRRKANIIPIEGRDVFICIRTVAAGADPVPREEWHHALLYAAEMIRDLIVVIDSGTVIDVRTGKPSH